MSTQRMMLIVDDNIDFCQNVADMLELEGFTARTAYNGIDALEIVKQSTPDAAIIDVKLPDMNGVTLLKNMKRLLPTLPVILISGFTAEELLGEATQAGANAFMEKPIDFQKLFGLLSGFLA